MPIEFRCHNCQSLLRIPDDATGRWISCPNCGSTNSHPTSKSPSKPDFSAPSVDQYQPAPSSNPYGAPTPNYGPSGYPPRQVVSSRTLPAAIVWLVIGLLNLLFVGIALLGGIANVADNRAQDEDLIAMIFFAVIFVCTMIGVSGAICMLKMRFHTYCVVAAAATIISGISCCFIPSGVAIWVLVVLLLPGARYYFSRRSASY